MNELDLFQLSLTKKSPQFLKSGGYHFKVPERVKGQWAGAEREPHEGGGGGDGSTSGRSECALDA